MGAMFAGVVKKPKGLVSRTKVPAEMITELDLPVATYLAVDLEEKKFDAVEVDQFGRVYVHENIKGTLLNWLEEFTKKNKKKVIAIGLCKKYIHSKLASTLWLKYDIVPNILPNHAHHSTDELIQSARVTASLFDRDLAVAPLIYDYNRVVPSYLVSPKDYQQTVSYRQWKRLKDLAEELGGKKIRFFSATPQGGGVALMRHALIRVMRMTKAEVSWHVLYDDPEVFEITKRKFHNVLQDVAPKGTRLTTAEKKKFDDWSKLNAEQFRPIIEDSEVVIIDDPQPAGLVKYIKIWNPRAKIIYRSHIQVESHLTDKKGTTQYNSWNFIYNKVKSAQLFVAHPVKEFVPKTVEKKKVVMMPPTTDPLDGLNKEMSRKQNEFYLSLFNKYLIENGQNPLDTKRDYLIQVARFDPSKGIPDVLEAYRRLTTKMRQKERPQLVIVGHGSIDDPDGIPIYDYVRETLASKEYKQIRDEIKVARLPHVDQPLNALLRGAKVALQLSHKEGFEVKVTEALMMGVPVVVYKSGGIPLQVRDGVNGYVIETGKVGEVAEKLLQLLTNKRLYRKMRIGAVAQDYSQIQTVENAIKWLFLAKQVLNEKFSGDGREVREFFGD